MADVAPGGGGGEFTYRQLESLWLSAGGRRSLAPTMAAIAEAESGGNPSAENPSGATGLWQILGAVNRRDQGHLTSPSVNAREAVLKDKTQGLGAWTTYTSGAWRKFLQKGTASPGVEGGKALVDEAEKFDGTPYVWGGTTPKGFDCSGLVQYAAEKVGLKDVPRTSEQQWAASQHISRNQLAPGDLVFYAGSDGTPSSPGHVAIYAGDGNIIQAEETGTKIGKFPIGSAGTPVGYGRLKGTGKADFTGATSGSGGGGVGGGGGGTPWNVWLGSAIQGLTGTGWASSFDQAKDVDASGAGLVAIGSAVTDFEKHVQWFFVPNHWLRIGCFLVGVPMVGIGIANMARTGASYSVASPVAGASVGGVGLPSRLPAPGGQLAPAIGIAEVTIGAILLFVAFHNLSAQNVGSFPELISYLQGALHSKGAQPTDTGSDG